MLTMLSSPQQCSKAPDLLLPLHAQVPSITSSGSTRPMAGRRRKSNANHESSGESGSQLMRQTSLPSNDARATPMSHRSNLERPTTPELEMIERGPSSSEVDANEEESTDDFSEFGSLSTIDTLGENESEMLGLIESVCDEDKNYLMKGESKRQFGGELDVEKYMARREMTPLQERMNAVTIIPGAFYCFLFLLSGAWLDKSLEDEVHEDMVHGVSLLADDVGCLSSAWLPHLHALPPLPVIAGAFGIVLHAPFSFLYHWSYAHRLPPGLARTTHWSRRMDQVMIHFCSASMAYATSGRWDFFLANLLYNMDCIYRQLMPRVKPRRNQIRILISVVAYTIPILRRGDMRLFSELWILLAISFSLFGMYPIGGWSHSAFHLVMAFVPPLLMNAATGLPASQAQLKVAAQCAVIAKQSLES